MDVPRYCSKCGAQLNVTSNFCASCGKQVLKVNDSAQSRRVTTEVSSSPPAAPIPEPRLAPQLAPAPKVAAPTPDAETLHLVLAGANRHSGFLGFKVESFIVVFTNLRIIFALQTQQMMQANIQRARLEAENEGKNFFGKWGAQIGANSGKQYWQMTPQQILAEQPSNFAINRDQLRSIRMREQQGDENSISSYTMEFDTIAGKHKFRLGSLNIRENKKLFQQLYGNIVR